QQPQAGRLIAPSDNRILGGHPVAVVSDGYWRHKMGAAPAVGRQLAINGTSFTIIGIAGPRFFGATVGLRSPDVWIPYTMQSAVRYSQNVSSRDSDTRKPWVPQVGIEWLTVFARVPRGTPLATVATVLTTT